MARVELVEAAPPTASPGDIAQAGLLEPAEQLGDVSQACKIMGYSRDIFYRFNDLHDKGGELTPWEMTRRKPLLRNQVASEVEAAV